MILGVLFFSTYAKTYQNYLRQTVLYISYQRKNLHGMFREYEKSLEIMSQGQVILKLCKSSPNIPRGLVLGKPTESVGGASIRYLEVYSTIDIRF